MANTPKLRVTLRRLRPHASLVDALGGPTALAAALAASTGHPIRPLQIGMWRQRHIPPAWRFAVAKLARERGHAAFIPSGFIIGG
jgi:hypothetical protein